MTGRVRPRFGGGIPDAPGRAGTRTNADRRDESPGTTRRNGSGRSEGPRRVRWICRPLKRLTLRTPKRTHHRDTEDTEKNRWNNGESHWSFLTSSFLLCVLCVSVVSSFRVYKPQAAKTIAPAHSRRGTTARRRKAATTPAATF